MKHVTVALIALAALLAPAAADAPKCQLVRFVSLPISLDPAGRAVVPLKLDDNDVRMLVDTGAFHSVIAEAAVTRLHLAVRANPGGGIIGFGGKTENRYVRVNKMWFGKVPLRNIWLYLDPWKQMGEDYDGLVGGDVLQVMELDFDFAGGKLGLFSQEHCPGKVVYWTNDPHAEIPFKLEGNHITLDVTVDGETMKAIIDTGASRTVMSLDTAKDVFDGVNDKTLADNDGRYPFKTLEMGGVAVRNPTIMLIADEHSKAIGGSGAPKIILGMNVLRQLHLFISYKERILYVTPASAHK